MVASPNRRDKVWCKAPTPDDPDRKEKRNKLMRTISVRVLHNDLFKPETGLPEIVMKGGVSQLSDTALRRIMPPEVKKMEQLSDVRCKTVAGNKYPEGCSFSTCITAMLVLSWESIA